MPPAQDSAPRAPLHRNRWVLVSLPLLGAGLFFGGMTEESWTERLFLDTSYYLLSAMIACWLGSYLYAARDCTAGTGRRWLRDNWPGLLIAGCVTLIASVAIEPALRVLSDEANLVGISKNLFSMKSPTYTVSGKYYYDTYWDVGLRIDQRPLAFPFFVSLFHTALGYQVENAFIFNLCILPVYVLLAYRLGKTLFGEVGGLLAAFFSVAHPIVLISARSGGFDFLALFFALLVLDSARGFLQRPNADRLAILWMNLCVFASIRYESALFCVSLLILLCAFRRLSWSLLAERGFLLALTPAFLLPRLWLSVLKGNVPPQEPGAVTFSIGHFANNLAEYFAPLTRPSGPPSTHSSVLIALGCLGAIWGIYRTAQETRTKDWTDPKLQFTLLATAWVCLQVLIVFPYVWGRAQWPSAARLLLGVDLFFSFAAAGLLATLLKKSHQLVPLMLACALLVSQLPIAVRHPMMNRLTQTRESAETWRFFAQLPSKRVIVVTDRPNHFAIMNYGAMSFQEAKSDEHLFTALDRGLFQAVYVIQRVRLSSGKPYPGYDLWTERPSTTVHQFQNDADLLIRVSRFERQPSIL